MSGILFFIFASCHPLNFMNVAFMKLKEIYQNIVTWDQKCYLHFFSFFLFFFFVHKVHESMSGLSCSVLPSPERCCTCPVLWSSGKTLALWCGRSPSNKWVPDSVQNWGRLRQGKEMRWAPSFACCAHWNSRTLHPLPLWPTSFGHYLYLRNQLLINLFKKVQKSNVTPQNTCTLVQGCRFLRETDRCYHGYFLRFGSYS